MINYMGLFVFSGYSIFLAILNYTLDKLDAKRENKKKVIIDV